MRHRNKIKKLGRTASHRKATLKNLAAALIEHRQIRTTLAKAKAAQSYMDKMITRAKDDSVHSRRQVFKLLQSHQLVKNLFEEIAPTFAERNGGYTRVVKLGQRQGDGAHLAILQLVGFESLMLEEAPKPAKKEKKKPAKEKEAETPEAETKAAESEKEAEPKKASAQKSRKKSTAAQKKKSAAEKEETKDKGETEEKETASAEPKEKKAKKSKTTPERKESDDEASPEEDKE